MEFDILIAPHLADAKDLLKTRNSGPSGILAYTYANAVRTEELWSQTGHSIEVQRPYNDPKSHAEAQIYYAVVRHNRTGLDVAVPPGGTQDILMTIDGTPSAMELGKPSRQAKFLQSNLGLSPSGELSDVTAVAALLASARVKDVRLETSFDAAVHETREENGWDYVAQQAKVLSVAARSETLFTKRSFDTTPPQPVVQKIFVVHARDFDDVTLAITDKVEMKNRAQLGRQFNEWGDFLTRRQMWKIYEEARTQFDNNPRLSTASAHGELMATHSRLEMVARIQNAIKDAARRPAGAVPEIKDAPQL